MFDWLDPYSIKNLRRRAKRLPECPYRLVLELSADQIEAGKVTKKVAKKAIEYVRTNDLELTIIAFKMLDISEGQRTLALQLLKKMS